MKKSFFLWPTEVAFWSTIIECSIAKVLNFNLPNDMNEFTFAYFRLENGIWDTVMKLIFQTREGSIHFLDSIVMLQIIIQGETIYHIKIVLNLLYFYLVTKPLSIFFYCCYSFELMIKTVLINLTFHFIILGKFM